jgi:hypothetical protein
MGLALQWLLNTGCTEIILGVLATSEHVVEFYQKWGFQEDLSRIYIGYYFSF